MFVTLLDCRKKLIVFTDYYNKLIRLNFKALCPHLVTAEIISIEDNQIVQNTVEPSKATSYILEKVDTSLKIGVGDVLIVHVFDRFLFTLENCDNLAYRKLAKQLVKPEL